jgi:ferritin-like metal-binding protein YciE
MPKEFQSHPAAPSRHGRPIHAAGAMQLELIRGGMADSTSGKRQSSSALRDAGILAAAQAAAHYEIARYGTLRAWAGLLGQEEAVERLSETLVEEKRADDLLTSIADGGVNESATRSTTVRISTMTL